MSPDAPQPATWRVLLEALRAHGKEELALQIEKSEESQPYHTPEELRQMYEDTLAKKDDEIARIKLGERSLQKKLKEADQIIAYRDEEIKTLRHQMQQTTPGPTVNPEGSPQTFQSKQSSHARLSMFDYYSYCRRVYDSWGGGYWKHYCIHGIRSQRVYIHVERVWSKTSNS